MIKSNFKDEPTSIDIEEKKKIQYAIGILYQLFFYIRGE